jgi:hypothetical protein
MKKSGLISLSLGGSLMILFAFTSFQINGIQGKVLPLQGAGTATAVLGLDTLKTPIVNGNFKFSTIKPGTYSVTIKGTPPYLDSTVVNIAVIRDATTDVGSIRLRQTY